MKLLSLKNKRKNIIATVLAIILLLSACPLSSLAVTVKGAGNSYFDVSYEQTKVNYTNVKVTVPCTESLINLKKADSITVTAEMYYLGTVTRSLKKTVTLESIKRTNSFNIELPTFGEFVIKAEFFKSKVSVAKAEEQVIGIVANEYNICPITASFPVAYLSLTLWDITKNSETNEPIPTFVVLSRSEAYDWNKLPENVYGQPNLTQAELEDRSSSRNDFTSRLGKMADYVLQLYKLNPNAKFNLYINDCDTRFIIDILVANGIPQDQYKVTLLSDGSGSYSHFNSVFNVADPQAKYDEMLEGWKNACAYAQENGNYQTSLLPYTNSSNYAAVVANEYDNVTWWVGRKNGTFSIAAANTSTASEETKTAINSFISSKITNSSSVIEKSMASMLTNLQSKGDETIKAFKSLYKFNDSMFSSAEETGKKIICFLGTRVTSETYFDDYAKFVVAYYGEDYGYFYKGHPATPTSLYPSKAEQLESLGIEDVESSIAAELILFFKPDIYLAGYQSTTFQSAQDDKVCCLFNTRKENASSISAGYGSKADFYMSPLKNTDTLIIESCGLSEGMAAGKTYLLAEFNNSKDYDIAIWDSSASTITFYKAIYNESNEITGYTFVSKTDSMKQQTIKSDAPASLAFGNSVKLNAVSDSGNAVTYTSSNEKIAKVSKDGTVTATGTGKVKITMKANSNIFYKEVSKEITISCVAKNISLATATADKASYTYTGKTINPTITVKDGKKVLVSGTDYKVTYSSNKNPGTATATIKGIGNYQGTKIVNFSILPAKVSVVSRTSSTSSSITLKWSSVPGATGYIVYKYNPATKAYEKYGKATANTSMTIKSLKAGTTYCFRVRSYTKATSTLLSAYSSTFKTTTAPAKTALSLKSSKVSSLTATWSRVSGASGYELQFSTKSDFSSSVTKKNLSSTTASATYSNLKSGKTYYVRLRAYRTVDSQKVYGAFSTVKAIKIK